MNIKLPQQKILEGNRSKANKAELKQVEICAEEFDLTPPESLSDAGKTFWLENVQTFINMGVLRKPDRHSFAMYCHSMGMWLKLCKEIQDEGGEIIPDTNQVSQKVYAQRAHADLATKLGQLFGDTPVSRIRLAIRKEDKSDPVQAFLRLAK